MFETTLFSTAKCLWILLLGSWDKWSFGYWSSGKQELKSNQTSKHHHWSRGRSEVGLYAHIILSKPHLSSMTAVGKNILQLSSSEIYYW